MGASMDAQLDTKPSMYATCGKEKHDLEQRAEWIFHRGIPILLEEDKDG